MSVVYFIDESGHGGDIAKAKSRYDFNGQPIFVLACVGIPSDSAIEEELSRIRLRYNCASGELKSDSIAKRPQMSVEIIDALLRANAPIMIEVVDKRFFICMNITSFLLLPFAGRAEQSPQLSYFRNIFAEYLCENLPDSTLDLFISAFDVPSNQSLIECLEGIEGVLTDSCSDSEVAAWIKLTVRDRMAELGADGNDDDWKGFLPAPDKNKSDKNVWLLPNLSSLMNIYARINLAHDGKIEGVDLLHDEQAQYDEILENSKALAESLVDSEIFPFTPHSDYRFYEKATLRFVRSHEHSGIQIADTLAGFVMRYVRGTKSYRRKHAEAFDLLQRASNVEKGIGINFVMPTRSVLDLGVRIA